MNKPTVNDPYSTENEDGNDSDYSGSSLIEFLLQHREQEEAKQRDKDEANKQEVGGDPTEFETGVLSDCDDEAIDDDDDDSKQYSYRTSELVDPLDDCCDMKPPATIRTNQTTLLMQDGVKATCDTLESRKAAKKKKASSKPAYPLFPDYDYYLYGKQP